MLVTKGRLWVCNVIVLPFSPATEADSQAVPLARRFDLSIRPEGFICSLQSDSILSAQRVGGSMFRWWKLIDVVYFGSSASLCLRGQCRYQDEINQCLEHLISLGHRSSHLIQALQNASEISRTLWLWDCMQTCKAHQTWIYATGAWDQLRAACPADRAGRGTHPCSDLNSSFIHNVTLQLRDAGINVTALDAKRPLSCCCAYSLEKKCVWIFSKFCTGVLVSWDLDCVGDEETTERLKLSPLLLQGGLI